MTYQLLDQIQSPVDVKNLNVAELKQLATQIRNEIIEVMSKNGGHLASNLGAVEFTLCLHKIFNSPQDKFIWDVSHQTYTHKILTGRRSSFHTIRQSDGLCGFSHPVESEHDHFFAGHAGTALSLSLGMAKSRDLSNASTSSSEYVIPIIGDATLTCGLALEALNNLPANLKKFIIVLNDNAMSISKNVGAIHSILKMLLLKSTGAMGQVLEEKFHHSGQNAPEETILRTTLDSLEDSIQFFEHYNLTYLGPVDGHNITDILQVMEEAKTFESPVIIHLMTKKGQGMQEAVDNPISYHGAKPFSKDTGKFLPSCPIKPTFPKVFGDQLLKMAAQDDEITVITPAMSAGSCLDKLMHLYPHRCFDVGIAESHAVTFAGGLAKNQKRKVIVSIYSTFLQRALDNLFHDICLQHIPVVFAIDRAGISGPDGPTHHGIYDISFLNSMPNMIICQPRNGQVLRSLLKACFSWQKPVAIRYPNQVTTDDNLIEESETLLGKSQVLRNGYDFLIIALGHLNEVALKVSDKLEDYNITATVLDPIFIKPLDIDMLELLLKSHTYIITLEEHSLQAGLGSIINNYLMKTNNNTKTQVLNIGIEESFIEHGSYSKIMEKIGLTTDKITCRILNHFHIAQAAQQSTLTEINF